MEQRFHLAGGQVTRDLMMVIGVQLMCQPQLLKFQEMIISQSFNVVSVNINWIENLCGRIILF